MLPTRQADFSVCTVEVLVHLPPSMTDMVAGLCYMVATAQTSLTVLLSSDLRARVLPARRLWPEGGKSAEQLSAKRGVCPWKVVEWGRSVKYQSAVCLYRSSLRTHKEDKLTFFFLSAF